MTRVALDDFKVGQMVTHEAGAQGSLEQLRQNMYALHARNLQQYVHDGSGSDWTTTSFDLVKIDATNFQLTITTNGGPVMTWFHGSIRRLGGSEHYVYFTILRENDPVDPFLPSAPMWATTYKPLSLWKPYPFLPAGTHTFAAYWRIVIGSATTATLEAASCPQFHVWEGY